MVNAVAYLTLFTATALAANIAPRQDAQGDVDIAVDVTATADVAGGTATGAADIQIDDGPSISGSGDAAEPSGFDVGGDASADASGGVSPPVESAPAPGGAAATGLTWSAAVGLVAYLL